MKRVQLSRNETKRLRRDQSALAEELAAREYGYSTTGGDFDAVRDTGSVLEVKSTVTHHDNGARGRFRLWKPQHESLTRRDRDGSAWYVFVLFDVSSSRPPALLVRQNPADVGRMIGARGGWNRSGHRKGKQLKLPWSAVFGEK